MRGLAVLLLVLLVPASPAAAGTVQVLTEEFEASVVYTAAPGERNDVSIRAGDAAVAISDEAGVELGPGCVRAIPGDERSAFCDPLEDVSVVRASLGDGDDRALVESTETPAVLRGGDGIDTLTGGDAPFDVLDGGAGADAMDGFGGEGDAVSYRSRTAPVVVDFDGRADDGESGEGDRITGIESAIGGAGNDTITGDGRDNELEGNGGRDLLRGRFGSDRLHGGDDVDILQGGNGSDALAGGDGADQLFGGPDDARDALAGEAGDDLLQGGRGSDDYAGGAGDDAVDARDGAFDAVACGRGNDDARLDGVDLVVSCRIRQRAGAPVPLADGFAPPRGRSVVVAVVCPPDMPSGCEGRFRISVGGRVFARGTFEAEAGAADFVRVRLGRRAVRRLVSGRGNLTVVTRDGRGRGVRFTDSLGRRFLI